MNTISIFVLAIAVATDAFAVSVSNGTSLKKVDFPIALRFGIYFGLFQAVMPILGWIVAIQFTSTNIIQTLDHWIAFGLLSFLGCKMILNARKKDEDTSSDVMKNSEIPRTKHMLTLALATSIDALAVGVSLAALNVSIWIVAIVVGIVTCIFSIVGVYIGNLIGTILKKGAEIFGGLLLILIGTTILIEHLFGM